jgi:hypothetical protein
MQISKYVLQKSQELKKEIDTNQFCELHGISESKFSRFPSEKLIEELELFDYMGQFLQYKQPRLLNTTKKKDLKVFSLN